MFVRTLFILFLYFFPLIGFAQVDTTSKYLQEVVVSSSRISEQLLYSPVSILKVGKSFFQQSSQASIFDALENVQGVQLITPSLGFKVINARGFSNTTNVRFSQLVDGVDMQSPHIGGPIGNALGPTDLDIDQVEIVTGIASTMYGMNTVNGLANLISKTPFDSPGFSFQQKAGFSTKLYTESTLRYSHPFSSKWAFKINASFVQGSDWEANNLTDLNPLANSSTNLIGENNPGRDLVNMYGNESSNRKTITLQGKTYVVSRTGYLESDVVDYSIKNAKGDLGLAYQISPNSMLLYSYHIALLDNVYQRSNRFRLQDYLLQQHAVQYQSDILSFKLYTNSEDTGNSYNLRSMAENIDRNFKSDVVWYDDYTKAFNSATTVGTYVAEALNQARAAADLGRYQPGSPSYKDVLAKLQQINNWDLGAALKVKARLVHAEAQSNLSQIFPSLFKALRLDVIAGIDRRTYIIGSDGNYFVNPEKGNETGDILYSKTGAYTSFSKKLWADKLRLGFVFRVDKNDYFNLTSNPRLTVVFAPNAFHSVRVGYQEGYRFPSIFEAYSNINSGGVKRVGGLPVMSSGVFENSYLATSITAFQAAVLTDVNKNGLSKTLAIVKNKELLVKNPYTYIQPEHIQSIEGGYRGALLGNRLLIDADFYYNQYKSFIAQTNVNVPKTVAIDSIPFALNDKNLQSPYRVWTNSKSVVKTYGASFGFNYRLNSSWAMTGNVTYSKLGKSENDDGLEDGFNTPDWVLNVGLSSMKIAKNWAGGINYRWQNTYYWQSFLANDWVPAYGSLDMQIQYHFSILPVSIKLSGTNILNQSYYSFLGGPQIGGMYMLTLILNK
ncbi:TonB-dependent receptor plug domain-containing protein [Aquirufa nivalisilvae]|uniref:TonB-dependent receptor plug domain-containing protein n=1 Tax=Aquirufa nivalisilvae TaxID=2516557 RepID=UPI001032AE6A|nr:TonB-dependent receptor [Aquirufa nivalisilvae]TBH76345.1 TonB-dependent receptor [Aquirufa nivalisilvae]